MAFVLGIIIQYKEERRNFCKSKSGYFE